MKIGNLKLANYHSHFELDDGKGSLDQYAESAISKGFTTIGISPHGPVPCYCACTLTESRILEYIRLMPSFINKFQNRLEILTGLEIDYIPGLNEPSDYKWKKFNLDYKIGSVHLLDDPETGEHLPVDDEPENIIQLLNHKYSNSIRALVEDYFARQIDMIETGGFNILGHCDLIKKRNTDNRFFDADEKWYKDAAKEMLQTAAEKEIVVEINTGGLARKATTEEYPSPWILKRILQLDIPVTLSSDAHNPEHIDFHFTETIDLLKTIGFGETYYLSKGRWQSQPLY